MTVIDDPRIDEIVEEETEDEQNEQGDSEQGTKRRGRVRDLTKSSPHYDALTEFINTNLAEAGLEPVDPLQVKAILAFKTDYSNLPEQKEAREARKLARQAEKERFAGMSADQIKAAKASKRIEAQAERLQKRAQEALDKAKKLASAAAGSGEDLAAFVESQNEQADQVEEKPKRRLGRKRGGE